jgi:hypothetical protein
MPTYLHLLVDYRASSHDGFVIARASPSRFVQSKFDLDKTTACGITTRYRPLAIDSLRSLVRHQRRRIISCVAACSRFSDLTHVSNERQDNCIRFRRALYIVLYHRNVYIDCRMYPTFQHIHVLDANLIVAMHLFFCDLLKFIEFRWSCNGRELRRPRTRFMRRN